jgi:hypothetical protein
MEIQEVATTHETVMGGRVVLGEVVSKVIGILPPMDSELALGNAIFYPIQANFRPPGL